MVALALGILDSVMQVDEADALIDQLLHYFLMFLLEDRMTVATVHVEDDRFGAIEDLFILRPAIASHDGSDTGRFFEQIHEDGTAGEEFVFAGTVAGMAGDDDDLRQFR